MDMEKSLSEFSFSANMFRVLSLRGKLNKLSFYYLLQYMFINL